MQRFFFFFVLCTFCTTFFQIQAEEADDTAKLTPTKHYFSAIAGAETSNFLLYLNNRYIGSSDFSKVSLDSIAHNARSSWQWDQSIYWINETGHPYQGSTYFTSGRTNGLNFYESGALTMLGSASWEITCERSDPSVNDLITTTLGGMAFGEILHRLYLEATADNLPVAAAILSPVDAINNAINHTKPRATGGQIQTLKMTSGCGFEFSQVSSDFGAGNTDSAENPILSHGLTLVYGDPYTQTTHTPYTQFDVNMNLVCGPGWNLLSYYTDGFLYSVATTDTDTCKASVGLTLNYDVILSNTNTFGANSLDLTIKQLQSFGKSGSLSFKAHTGWIILGSSRYNPDHEAPYANSAEQLNNYGTGINAKIDITAGDPFFGTAGINAAYYYMWIIPNSAPYSEGTTACLSVKTSYSHILYKNITGGIANITTCNYGWYDALCDTVKYSNASMLFIEYDLK